MRCEIYQQNTIDTFYNVIKRKMENNERYDYFIEAILKLNDNKIPDKIQDLLDKNIKKLVN